MMRAVLFVFCLFSGLASASDLVSVQLADVRVVDLARLVFGEVSRKSFVLDSSALAVEDRVTVDLRALSPAAVEARTRLLLEGRGLSVSEVGGVVVVGKPVAAEREVVVYRPQFRSVTYLLDLCAAMFPAGSFSQQRGIAQGGVISSPGMGQGQQGGSGVVSAQGGASVADSGSSAFSMIDKTEKDALIFRGSEKDVVQLRKLLVQLDRAPGELLVRAVVYEVRRSQTEGSAVALAASLLDGKLGLTIEGAAGATTGSAVKLKIGGDFNAVWSALSGDQRFKLVSSPTVRVRSGGQARFVAGSDVPVLGNVGYTQTGQAVQSVEYKTSGVVVDLRPQVREGAVDLQILQQISSFVATTTGVNQTPTLLKRELSTTVTAGSDEVVMLGGLDETSDTDNDSGLSFLPSFLRTSSAAKQRTEIVLMLHVQRL